MLPNLFWFRILNFVGTAILRLFSSAWRNCFSRTLLLQISDLCSVIDKRVWFLKMIHIIRYRHNIIVVVKAQLRVRFLWSVCVLYVLKGHVHDLWSFFFHFLFNLQCLRNAFLKINQKFRVSRRDISMIQSSHVDRARAMFLFIFVHFTIYLYIHYKQK